MGRIFVYTILIVAIVVIGVQVERLRAEYAVLEKRALEGQRRVNALSEDREKLKAELEYFANARNRGKEARSLFNLKNPGEQLYILVPPQ